jgi:chloramphenicol O-acetyltransferase type A
MKKELDIETWARRDHFHFFKQFEEPFFGVTAPVDCTLAYTLSKETGISFFLYYLYCSVRAANELTPFRYRISAEGGVYEYEQIHPSATINREDGTFGFSYIPYSPSLPIFMANAQKEVERVRNTRGLELTTADANVIHYSSLPWIAFTSLSHARMFSLNDSIPKITFGKLTTQGNKKEMPVSVHVHHALLDGYDVGLYFEAFQELLNQ